MFTGQSASIAILAALRHRDRTGQGQAIDVNLFETMTSLLQHPLSAWLNAGVRVQRTGNDASVAVPYGVFSGSDAKFVIGVLNDREFVRLAAALGHPEWATDARFRRNRDRVANRSEVLAMMRDVLIARTRAEWLAVLRDAKITSGPINTPEDIASDPHILERGMIVEVPHHQAGKVRVAASPLHMSVTPVTYRHGIPAPGEHSDAILKQLAGMDDAEIAEARRTELV
jgi:crotonobetainyl-CoA:carnitine CoA-transferase CaiB-like acyl-CoA transferase